MYDGPQELMYINGSRRKVLVASVMEIFNTGYYVLSST